MSTIKNCDIYYISYKIPASQAADTLMQWGSGAFLREYTFIRLYLQKRPPPMRGKVKRDKEERNSGILDTQVRERDRQCPADIDIRLRVSVTPFSIPLIVRYAL